MEEYKEKRKPIFYLNKTEIIAFLFVGIILILIPILFINSNISWISFKDTGTIGDTIGGITAPFIGFGGAILVYLALKAQVEANNLVQKQFKEQEKTNYRQNFETTFFNLLNIHHNIVDSMDYNPENLVKYNPELNYYINCGNSYYLDISKNIKEKTIFSSRDVFSFTFEMLRNLLLDDLTFSKSLTNEPFYNEFEEQKFSKEFSKLFFLNERVISFNNVIVKSKFLDIYNMIYLEVKSDFGHYFRNLYRIIKLIDEQNFDSDEILNFKIKYNYTSILRAQLSDDEINWIFFNCLTDKGSSKFKPLLEKYSLLKTCDTNDPLIKYYNKLYHISASFKNWDEDIKNHIRKFN